ncbi:MAG: DUF882 domain-containing protein [Beijerinckiaceae bacterium]
MIRALFSPASSRLLSTTSAAGVAVAVFSVFVPTSTQTAVANGDTRTISFSHAHRKDSGTFTFRRNGRYDPAVLSKLNYFLRDWRNDAQIRMDPRLFDVIWEAHRSVGAHGSVIVLSSYRSPNTNSMLRRRSRAVAKNSQHMLGKAMDMRFPGVNMHRVREIAMKMQRGGVGWYPSSRFVHLDVGNVRAWPRMSYGQLARLFPDGKTVHISADGRTLPGYEEARTMVASRNGSYVPTLAQVQEKSFLARLFGWGDEGDEADQTQARRDRRQIARNAPLGRTGPADSDDQSAASFFRRDAALQDRNPASGAIRVATRQAPEQKVPTRAALAPAPAPTQPKTAAKTSVRAEPVAAPIKLEPKRPASDNIAAPVPPRRPTESRIAALIGEAVPTVPLPPQRPENLIVVAESTAAATAPLPPDPRGRLAALIGSNAPGAIAGKEKLPSVITRGTSAGGTNADTPDALAFAAPLALRRDTQTRSRKTNIRRVALRRNTPSAPAMAQTIGVRSAARDSVSSMLVAARFDRSNFALLTRPDSIAGARMSSLVRPAIAPLRSAARFNPDRLAFTKAELFQSTFVSAEGEAKADTPSKK